MDVRLARTGVTVEIPAHRSILEASRAQGVKLRSSCEAGSCLPHDTARRRRRVPRLRARRARTCEPHHDLRVPRTRRGTGVRPVRRR
ncbi:MAG: 2Fe-2S iron-sulfur cluster binding domain-containing protein [Betaproteobacteria bacterium]